MFYCFFSLISLGVPQGLAIRVGFDLGNSESLEPPYLRIAPKCKCLTAA